MELSFLHLIFTQKKTKKNKPHINLYSLKSSQFPAKMHDLKN